MQKLSPSVAEQLKSAAIAASEQAYCPYSKFRVGAAILTETGKIYSGCNVENASYGLTNCAERTAIFKAVSEGAKSIQAVFIYTPTEQPTAPCGACRQVINEFGPEAIVRSYCCSRQSLRTTVPELLPHAFGPKNLL